MNLPSLSREGIKGWVASAASVPNFRRKMTSAASSRFSHYPPPYPSLKREGR
jgi:hypothetical protein